MRIGWISVVGVLVIAGLGIGGYLAGQSRAPSAADADELRRSAYEAASSAAEKRAAEASRERGKQAGLTAGERNGTQAGMRAGSKEGGAAAAEQLADAETPQVAATTPEGQCAGSIGDPGPYGQCLDQAGQDPGAPLTSYCDAHPEIEADLGYCPSLNE
jgi:hypothetical protein